MKSTEPNLCHLEPFVFSIPWQKDMKGETRQIPIKVIFSCHCWSKGILDEQDEPMAFWDGKRKRLFDQERYDFSKQLPDIIKTLPKRRLFRDRNHRNYVTYSANIVQNEKCYVIFFKIFKNRGVLEQIPYKLELYVQSAHFRDSPEKERKKFEKISFYAMIKKTFEGK